MKKLNIIELAKKPGVVIGLEVFATFLIGILLVFFVVLPKFKSWQESASQNKETKQHSEKVSKNIESIKGLDKTEIEKAGSFLDEFLPAEEDPLKFVSLAEAVAAASGMKVSAIQADLGKSTKPTTTPTSVGSSSGPTISSGSTTASSTTATSLNQPAAAAKKGVTFKLSLEGEFPSIPTLLANFEKAGRAMLITQMNLSSTQSEGGGVSLVINFTLPLFTNPPAASAENLVMLTPEETKLLGSLLEKNQIKVAPAKNPLGRQDPFK